MKCKSVRKQLSAFQDGHLPDDEKYQIGLHLDICRSCSRRFHELNDLWNLLSILPESEPLPFFYTRLKEGLNTRSGIRPRHWIEKAIMPIATLAMVAFGMVVGSLAGKFPENSLSDNLMFSELPAESLGLFSLEPLSDGYFELFGQGGGDPE